MDPLQVTIQILRFNSGPPTSLGTGILFVYEMNYFIITAGHNLHNENFKSLLVRVDQKLYKIYGETFFWIDEESEKNTKLDWGIIKLINQDLISDLMKYQKFLQLRNIELNPKQKFNKGSVINEEFIYYLIGFPSSQTNKSFRKNEVNMINCKISVVPEYLISPVPKEIQEEYSHHLFFTLIKKATSFPSGNKVTKPNDQGFSGCGLWDVVSHNPVKGERAIKLVGIFIEIKRNIGISVKINCAIEMIRRRWNLELLPKPEINFPL